MNISVFGLGYVGTVSSACLAKMGHRVIGVDVQKHKVEAIRAGRSPIVEPGVAELIKETLADGSLSVTQDATAAVRDTELSLVCVGTPSTSIGAIDLAYLEAVSAEIGHSVGRKSDRHVVAIRSTIIPGAIRKTIIPILEESSGLKVGKDLGVCANPEFLREGTAIEDFRYPPMIVIGQTTSVDGDVLAEMYQGLQCPILRCSPDEAMMVKYA